MIRILLVSGFITCLGLAFTACSDRGTSSHPKTPGAVVEALFEQVRIIKAAAKKAKEEGSTDEAAKELAKSKTDLNALFLNQDKAKLLMMPLAFVQSEQVEFIEEKIDDDKDKAEVTIEHTIVGFGALARPEGLPPERRQLTFQLEKQRGRWLISDIGGVLASYGR